MVLGSVFSNLLENGLVKAFILPGEAELEFTCRSFFTVLVCFVLQNFIIILLKLMVKIRLSLADIKIVNYTLLRLNCFNHRVYV